MSPFKLDHASNEDYAHNMNRAKDWFRQAEDDYLWAKETLDSGRYAQACFVAQQVSEKALKALALMRGYDSVRSHSLLQITKAMDINGEIQKMAMRLDQYYLSARYPDAYLEGSPFEYFSREQAEEACRFAGRFLEMIGPEIHDLS